MTNSIIKLKHGLLAAFVLSSAVANQSAAAVENYTIDPSHSSVGFTIRHFVSKVPGRFGKFEGAITVDRDNLEKSTVSATIDVTSIDTNEADRDTHLRSADFFNVTRFPQMTFKSTSWKKTGDNQFDVTGDLTIKGITKQVVLKTTLLGFGPGARGAELSGWEATTRIKKADFDLKGPAMLGAMLGDDVDITLAVEAVKK